MPPQSLARVAGDFITLVQLVQQAPVEQLPDAKAMRSQALSLLEDIAKQSSALGIDSKEIDEARFALAVWADETILRSQWPGRETWGNDSLQRHLFNTARGGNEFYEHLAALSPQQNQAREVYFFALALGFEGQYAGQPDQRTAVITHQYESLRAAGRSLETSTDNPIVPSGYELDIEVPRVGSIGLLGIIGLMLAGLAGVYAIAWGVLYFVGGDVPLPTSMR